MNQIICRILPTVIAFPLLFACGGRETVAERSAEAFREAQQKGQLVGGGHEHATRATEGKGMDHSNMPGMQHGAQQRQHPMAAMDHSNMPGMQHGAPQQGQHPMAAMDHSNMPGMQHGAPQQGQHPMAGMDHSNMPGMQHGAPQQGQQPMAGMDHSNMPGMQHGAPAATAVNPVPDTNREMLAASPASTLQPDPLDTPARVALSEARKAALNIPDGDVRHIVPGSDQANPPTPQPAVWKLPPGTVTPITTEGPEPPLDHSQHSVPVPKNR